MKNPKKLRLQIATSRDEADSPKPNLNLLRMSSLDATDERDSEDPSNPSDKTIKAEEQKKDDSEDKKATGPPPVSQFQLFRYANNFEKFIMVIGAICAIANGCLTPLNIFVFGDMTKSVVENAMAEDIAAASNTTSHSTDIVLDAFRTFAIANSAIGSAMLILVYLSVMIFNYTSQRQAFRIRQMFLKSVLHQEISWYDSQSKSGNIATELTEEVIKFEEGIGEKFVMFIEHMTIAVSSIGFAFYSGWKLTLVCLASLPVTFIVLGVLAKVSTSLSRKELDAFGAASSVAEEALSAIRSVVAFNGQNFELDRYKRNLAISYKISLKLGLTSGSAFGFLWFGIYGSYALSLWYGVTLILDERHLPVDQREYDAANMVTVFFCTIVSAMNIGVASPYIEIFSGSKAAAAKIFANIERKSAINSADSDGIKLAQFRGSIEFRNIEFSYPSRADVPILKKLSFTIRKGETVALVGSSGCGKSTCIQLIQRFYDPLSGQILLDDYDLRDLNVGWLRSNVGIVGQEPVLFDTTIAENIRYGNLEATMDMVVEAGKLANAHDFIMKLPSKYDTLVGERGAKISGGQKQRIAIARALIRDPAILLLDEATSALDTRSERNVQRALDKAHKGRTTIIVAHRLTTIRNADKIIVLSDGIVVEEGKHERLMYLKGHYHALVTSQISQFTDPEKEGPEVMGKHGDIDEDDEDLEPIAMDGDEQVPDDNKNDEKKSENEVGTWKVLKLNKPEWKLLLGAGIVSIIVGFSMPLFAILFGDVLAVLSEPNDNVVREQSALFAIYFISAGVVIGLSTFIQMFVLTIASERLTTRLRGLAFEAMMKQEMAWFDDPANGTGALCAKLSTEAAAVKGATGQRIGTIVQSASTLIIAIGLSLNYEWRLGLTGMAFIPVILFITLLHGRVYKKETLNYHKNLESSTKIAVEAVSNIRTVVGLGREEAFYKNYVNSVIPSFEEGKRNTHYRGLVYGFSKSIGYFAFAAVLYYGGVLIQKDEADFPIVYKVAQALISGTLVIGQASAFSPNLQKGILAAGKIIGLLERTPKIQDPPNNPENIDDSKSEEQTAADVGFANVSFAYPSRIDVTVLNSMNLEVESGKTIALIGSSGCGKSTVIKLLERFYDPTMGTININGKNIASMKQSSLRRLLALVEQEPTVFARTIRDNIAYGDNSRDVTMEEIIEAAKKANIHNFIASLPLGYETKLGDKGTMLSGGEKQRVAIARALVRDPKILLLDEATSALDTESEKIVQAALDQARNGRTCIIIAHRLSTVEDADQICVLQNGVVVESGNHEQLIQLRGLYYEMLCLQRAKK